MRVRANSVAAARLGAFPAVRLPDARMRALSHAAMPCRRHTLSACMGLARRALVMLITVAVALVFSSPSTGPLTVLLGLSSCVVVGMRRLFSSWCRRVSE